MAEIQATPPTPEQMVQRYYEIEEAEGGIAKADLKRVAFLTAIDLGVTPDEVRKAVVDDLCKVGAG